MKKLRFVSVIIVLLLFCPFIKQCDGFTKIEEGAKADNSNELKVYFTEESENVFDLSYQINDLFLKNKKKETNSIELIPFKLLTFKLLNQNY